MCGTPNGIRTRAATLKGWCPRPLDDGGVSLVSLRADDNISQLEPGSTLDASLEALRARDLGCSWSISVGFGDVATILGSEMTNDTCLLAGINRTVSMAE